VVAIRANRSQRYEQPRLAELPRIAQRSHIRCMNFRIVSRGKKFFVEEITENGARILVGFNSEVAAARCIRDLVADQRAGTDQA
jgi:hypothetical protein